MNKTTLRLAAAMALCLPALAQQQSDPADGKSPAPALRYESAFTDYKPWKDVSAGDWRAANEAVAAPAPQPAPAASATGHEGHPMQGDRK
jgi:hypothetical protein